MYTIIFDDGAQMTLSADDVSRLSHDHTVRVTKARTNGAQTVFTIAGDHITNEWQIVANTHSAGEHDLFANMGRQQRTS